MEAKIKEVSVHIREGLRGFNPPDMFHHRDLDMHGPIWMKGHLAIDGLSWVLKSLN